MQHRSQNHISYTVIQQNSISEQIVVFHYLWYFIEVHWRAQCIRIEQRIKTVIKRTLGDREDKWLCTTVMMDTECPTFGTIILDSRVHLSSWYTRMSSHVIFRLVPPRNKSLKIFNWRTNIFDKYRWKLFLDAVGNYSKQYQYISCRGFLIRIWPC